MVEQRFCELSEIRTIRVNRRSSIRIRSQADFWPHSVVVSTLGFQPERLVSNTSEAVFYFV